MSYTSVHRFQKEDGLERVIHQENSGVKWMGFDRIVLKKGQNLDYDAPGREAALVLQSGEFAASADWKGTTYDGMRGSRTNPFDELPWAVYLPPEAVLHIEALSDLEFRIFTVRCETGNEPCCIGPEDVEEGEPGNEAMRMKRKYRHIFGAPGKKNDGITKLLIVGESISCMGGWVGFPAHKHDFDNEEESPLDEIFSFRLRTPEKGGYLLQHSYGLLEDGGRWDEVQVVEDDDWALGLSEGYHTSMAAPECFEYLLWGLGGEKKIYKVKFDPRFDASNF